MGIPNLCPRKDFIYGDLHLTLGEIWQCLLNYNIPQLLLVVGRACAKGCRHDPKPLVHQVSQAELLNNGATHRRNYDNAALHRSSRRCAVPVRLAHQVYDKVDAFAGGLAANYLGKIIVAASPIVNGEVSAKGFAQVALGVAASCHKDLTGAAAAGHLDGGLADPRRAGVDKN